MKRGLSIILASVVGLVVVAGGVLWIDPFGWRVWQRWMGGYDAAATAVPANTAVYVGLNLLNLDQERLSEIAGAFITAESDTPTSMDELDQQLLEQTGLSLTGDILPWLGQYAGLALLDVTQDATGQNSFHWVLLAESLDNAAADQFLAHLQEVWAARNGLTAESQIYKGIELTVFDGLVFGRSENLVLFGSSVEDVQEAIETQGEESLADSAVYQEATSQLPEGRVLTTYLDNNRLRDLMPTLAASLSVTAIDSFLPTGIEGTAVGLSLTNAGIQLDTATLYDPDELSPTQQQVLENPPTTETAVFFPDNTLVYVTIPSIQAVWENYRAAFIAQTSEADFADSMELFAEEFGLNPDTDLFPLLDGEAAVGLVPVAEGVLGNVGITAVLPTNQPTELNNTLTTFSETMGNPQTGVGTVTTITEDNITLSQMESVLFPGWKLVYGINQGYLLLGSDPEAAQSLVWDGGESLASNARYQDTWSAFAGDLSPLWYVDIARFVELESLASSTAETGPTLASLTTLAAAGKTAETTAYQTIILFIETAEP